MRSLLALFATLLVAGACATTATTAPAAASADKSKTVAAATPKTSEGSTKWICEMVRPVGSMFPEQQCREVKRVDQERASGQQVIREAGRTTAPFGN